MSGALVPFPRFPVTATMRYRVRPRPKQSFHTVLNAGELLDSGGSRESSAAITVEGNAGAEVIAIAFAHPFRAGEISERLELQRTERGLLPARFTRSVQNLEQQEVRREEVDFKDRSWELPPATYPETVVPFLLCWWPFESRPQEFFAWINDRFVARMQFICNGTKPVDVRGQRHEALEVMMFPDINDWVSLGKVLTRMVRPFLPKYWCWYAPQPPHTLLRFEGSYGPPGAPEIILELV